VTQRGGKKERDGPGLSDVKKEKGRGIKYFFHEPYSGRGIVFLWRGGKREGGDRRICLNSSAHHREGEKGGKSVFNLY